MAQDVSERDFDKRVLARSRALPVVVDFWAEWCGPCRTLGPVLEREAAKRKGEVELVKVDVDANRGISARLGIQGIPAVKAFRNGEVVAEFVGAVPPTQVERFFQDLIPSEADELAAAADDEGSLRRALELDPGHAEARKALAVLLLRRGEAEEARELLSGLSNDFVADGLLARAELSLDGAAAEGGAAAAQRAFAAWDEGDPAAALEALQEALTASADQSWRDSIRRAMVAIFTELGADDPLAREHRRRLSAALN